MPAVTVSLDHIAIAARDAEVTARFLSELLEVPVEREGAADEFPCVRLANGVQILFQQATKVDPQHVAFRVARGTFVSVVDRLRGAGIPFGNDPEAPVNGEIGDPLGGAGRVYFHDGDGHLFEVCA